tara:strand:- start:462 stop:1001 length:540 start_codon:yes stop_codon:yes gene_type:complete
MTSENVEEKVLIACFFCERELRVPLTYSGMVRCPTCSKKFLIKSPEELKVDEGNLIDEESEKVIRDKKDLPEIKIFNNEGGSSEFWKGLVIPLIPSVIILILVLTGIISGSSSPDIIGLMSFMCSLCCWPIIGFILASGGNTFVKKFRDGARLSAMLALIIGGLIWIWFFSIFSGGITN